MQNLTDEQLKINEEIRENCIVLYNRTIKINGIKLHPLDLDESLESSIEKLKNLYRDLKITLRSRALELLLVKNGVDKNGYSLGLSYDTILKQIKKEFPWSKTTINCLNWYVVKLREAKRDVGEKTDLPSTRPRSKRVVKNNSVLGNTNNKTKNKYTKAFRDGINKTTNYNENFDYDNNYDEDDKYE